MYWVLHYLHINTRLSCCKKRVIRIISGVGRMTPSEPLFKEMSILTIDKLYCYNIGLLMYKYHHRKLPEILNVFKTNSEVHIHYTRNSDLLYVPKFKSEYGKRSFRYQAVKIWNEIYLSLSVDVLIGTLKGN